MITISNLELQTLLTFLNGMNLFVEIGTFKGETTVKLSEVVDMIVTIDPFLPVLDDRDETYRLNMDDVRKECLRNIEGKRIISIKQKSEDVLKWWHQPIDGVLIDGGHSVQLLEIDALWSTFVKPNGIVAFHDYSSYWSNVKDWIDNNIHLERILVAGSLIIFRK